MVDDLSDPYVAQRKIQKDTKRAQVRGSGGGGDSGHPGTGYESLQLGVGAAASEAWASAVGPYAVANATAGTALGFETEVTGSSGVAVGSDAEVNSENGVGVGANTFVEGTNGVAVGYGAAVEASNGTAVGKGSWAGGSSGTALGDGAEAGHSHSTALGVGAMTSDANQIMLGTAAEVVVVAGSFAITPGGDFIPSSSSDAGGVEGQLSTDGVYGYWKVGPTSWARWTLDTSW